jgi:ribosomal-protein-serine acetyltransferase
MLFKKHTITRELYLAAASTHFTPVFFHLIEQERDYLEQWMDWPQRVDSLKRCERYLREMELINGVGQQFFSFIFFREQLVGSIALARVDTQNRAAELGFWKSKSLLPKAQMEKVMQTFITVCWKNSPLHRLEIQTATTNLPAKLLSEKLGFVLEGSKRDALLIDEQFVNLDIYGLLRK